MVAVSHIAVQTYLRASFLQKLGVSGVRMAFIKKWSLRLVLLLVFVVVLLLATANSQSVTLFFLGYQSVEGPLSWWVIGAFVLGMIFSMTLNVVTTTRLKLDARRARHSAEQALAALDKANATPKPATTEASTDQRSTTTRSTTTLSTTEPASNLKTPAFSPKALASRT